MQERHEKHFDVSKIFFYIVYIIDTLQGVLKKYFLI